VATIALAKCSWPSNIKGPVHARTTYSTCAPKPLKHNPSLIDPPLLARIASGHWLDGGDKDRAE